MRRAPTLNIPSAAPVRGKTRREASSHRWPASPKQTAPSRGEAVLAVTAIQTSGSIPDLATVEQRLDIPLDARAEWPKVGPQSPSGRPSGSAFRTTHRSHEHADETRSRRSGRAAGDGDGCLPVPGRPERLCVGGRPAADAPGAVGGAGPAGGEDQGGLTNGDVTIDAVIGADNRTAVAYGNYTQFPWRTVGTILVAQTDKAGFCTAALISPRVAVTAGHCVYSQKTKAWSWNTWFSPGHRGRGSDRFPNGNPRPVVGLLSNTAWVNNGDVDHDVGFLVLADQPQTAALGYFGFMCKDTDDLEGGDIRMLQYPGWQYSCAASPDPSGQCFAFQYRGQSTINDDCGNLLEHQVDTNPGSSSSPSYRFVNGDRRIFGPHAYGQNPCDTADNKAVAMTSSKCKAACNLFANFPSQYASRSCN